MLCSAMVCVCVCAYDMCMACVMREVGAPVSLLGCMLEVVVSVNQKTIWLNVSTLVTTRY